MPEPPRLRKRPFGYKRADVDEALATRDAQLAELRQDIAALWLAFAQHDRMIREITGDAPPRPAAPPAEPAAATPDAAGDATAGVGKQLSELDEVLAAIEAATQTLERTYSDEVAASNSASGTDATSSEGSEQPGRGATS